MAVPNVINMTTMQCKSVVSSLSTVTANVLTVANDNVLRINDILLTNYSSNNITANIMFNRSSIAYFIAGNVSVPAFSTLVVIGKDSPIYLEEFDVLQANVSANSAVHFTSSYELII